jgi:hypothetical protein
MPTVPGSMTLRSRLRSVRLSSLVACTAIALLVAACAPTASGWSIRVDSTDGVGPLVLRYTSATGTTAYARAAERSDGGGILRAGPGDPEPGAAVAVLDPVSCRVIDEISKLPARHSYVAFLWGGGFYGASPYDPSDFGDPFDQTQRLPATDDCAESDPSATPAPLPSLAAGDWLNGWEMSCQATPDRGPIFGVRGEFLLGAVRGCRVDPPIAASQGVTQEIVWSNPGGDDSVLQVAWTAPGCSEGATVSIFPTLSRYHVHVIAISKACPDEKARAYAVTFLLAAPIDEGLVEGEAAQVIE